MNNWVNNPEAGDLRRQRAHSDVSVMTSFEYTIYSSSSNVLYLTNGIYISYVGIYKS